MSARFEAGGAIAQVRTLDAGDATERRFRALLEDGATVPADAEVADLSLPEYYDSERFKLGQRAFFNNVFTMMIAKLAGLLILLAVPSVQRVLRLTKQSGTPCLVFRRYVSTIFHTLLWYEKDPNKQVKFINSLKNVRRKHCLASKKACAVGFDRISQLDMALTQFGFIGFTLLSGEQLGVLATEAELDGLVHFWRVIGNMLGMEERFNLCTGTVEETRALCRRVLDEVFLPYLAKKDENFEEMGRALIEGLWPTNPYLHRDAFKAFTLHLAVSAAANNNHSIVIDTSNMSLFARFMLGLQLFVHRNLMPTSYRWSALFRAFFNTQMHIAVFLTKYFPFLAYWSFGRKQSSVDMYKIHSE